MAKDAESKGETQSLENGWGQELVGNESFWSPFLLVNSFLIKSNGVLASLTGCKF